MLPIILCIMIMLTVVGCIFLNCCYGNREIDLVRKTFDQEGEPKAFNGSVFYNARIYAAALFPTSDGKWNATIEDTQQAREDRCVGKQLEDFPETNVFVRRPVEVYWGFTFREWIMTVPPILGMIGPIILAHTHPDDCDDVPGLTTWIQLAFTLKISIELFGFLFRLDSPHSSPRQGQILQFGRCAFIAACIVGWVITWPHIGKGLTEELDDCEPVLYYIGFILSTLAGLGTIAQVIIEREKFCPDEPEFKYEDAEEMEQFVECCSCFRSTVPQEVEGSRYEKMVDDVEMSADSFSPSKKSKTNDSRSLAVKADTGMDTPLIIKDDNQIEPVTSEPPKKEKTDPSEPALKGPSPITPQEPSAAPAERESPAADDDESSQNVTTDAVDSVSQVKKEE